MSLRRCLTRSFEVIWPLPHDALIKRSFGGIEHATGERKAALLSLQMR